MKKKVLIGICFLIFLNNAFAIQSDTNYQAMHDVFGIYDQNNTGDVNISFKVRSCNDALCNGESFVGANGTTSEWFTTDFNNNNISWDLNGIAINRYFQYTFRIVSADGNYTGKLFDTNITYLNANSIVENGIKIGYPNNPLLTITSSGTTINGFVTIGNKTDANTGLTTGDLNISGKMTAVGIKSTMDYDINGTKGLTKTLRYLFDVDLIALTKTYHCADYNAGLLTKDVGC